MGSEGVSALWVVAENGEGGHSEGGTGRIALGGKGGARAVSKLHLPQLGCAFSETRSSRLVVSVAV